MNFFRKIFDFFIFIFSKIFGTRNERELKKYLKRVAEINSLEPELSKLSDDELKQRFFKLKETVLNSSDIKIALESALVESFAITREASQRVLKMRHYDVQLIGGMVLNEGKIAEMKTGEGKTLVATLPIILNAMTKKGVHLVTVNDYLAKRDSEEMRPLYEFLGYTVGAITDDINDDFEKKEQYQADITYGTNNEFGFDYLRDNMKYSLGEKVQRGHNFVIVDEVDSILIDEARTPLIISGPTERKLDHYLKANEVAQKMVKGEKIIDPDTKEDNSTGDFTVDEKNRVVLVTEAGIKRAEELFEVDNLYSLENAILSHHLDQALKANYLFEKDVDYVVQNEQIIIVDEFTGRLSDGRRYSDGLHQALEAKENVKIKEESQTFADITFQNYFRMYDKLAGMTGTAQTEATEFSEIYNLDVVSIPTNLPINRVDENDLIYKTEDVKFRAVLKKIKELHKSGQPVLVGTASIEKSEKLHKLLKRDKVPHTVLNAKNHEQEGEIIKKAGQKGAVTIATNMAGRGVDIKLGGGVKELGGLFIIGTERHENRRIDNQLRGRAGRQGDPGNSVFYLSLEDNLLRIFGSDRIKAIMERLGVDDDEHIESGMVTRAVEKAQKKVESHHFSSRKHIVEYDDVANEQRKTVFKFRDQLLDSEFDIASKIKEIRTEYIASLMENNSIIDGLPTEDFNISGLVGTIQEELNISFKNSDFENLEALEIEEKLSSELESKYEEKMSVLNEVIRGNIEREIYLETLDSTWRNHLYSMDIMKQGIGLRGYNQKDPLVEYKKESYHLFSEFREAIKYETFKKLTLFKIAQKQEVENTQDEVISDEIDEFFKHQELKKKQDELARVETNKNPFGEEESEQKDSKRTPFVAEKKPKRNDPCPCGSGKKYKQCCGKSGPQKGAFAQNS
jgi:preprotein translocase subunit SecA